MNNSLIVNISLERIIQILGRLLSTGYLFVLCTVLMPFYKVGINFLFIGGAILTIAGYFLLNPSGFKVYVGKYLLALIAIYSLCFFVHFNAARISTFLYSLFFAFSFSLILPNLIYYVSKRDFGRILRIILYTFLVVMIIQQLSVITGKYIINLNPEFSDEFLSTLSWFRINSLSSEPSYGATIIAIIAIVYFYLFPNFSKEFVRFWLPTIYTFVCFNSSLATVLVILVVLILISGNRFYWLFAIPAIAYPVLMSIESESRLVILIQELDFQNFADSFITTDLSGAFRIIPNYFYMLQANPASLNFYTGHGVDFATIYISRLMPGLEDDFNFPGGALPYMLFDYGLLTFLAFSFFLLKEIKAGQNAIFVLFGVFVMLNANFNTQLMWIFITFFFLCRHYTQKEGKENHKPKLLGI